MTDYYPFDLALHTVLEEAGYNVSYRNGIATISYGSRFLSFKKEGDHWLNLNRHIPINTRSAICSMLKL